VDSVCFAFGSIYLSVIELAIVEKRQERFLPLAGLGYKKGYPDPDRLGTRTRDRLGLTRTRDIHYLQLMYIA
jgi:hypothetical protein